MRSTARLTEAKNLFMCSAFFWSEAKVEPWSSIGVGFLVLLSPERFFSRLHALFPSLSRLRSAVVLQMIIQINLIIEAQNE